jgi:mono/diheme cytochrome c family protein
MRRFWRPLCWAALVLLTLMRAVPAADEEDVVKRGEYLVRAGGCVSCHTTPGSQKLAGGRALATHRPVDRRAISPRVARGNPP